MLDWQDGEPLLLDARPADLKWHKLDCLSLHIFADGDIYLRGYDCSSSDYVEALLPPQLYEPNHTARAVPA